VNGLKGEDGQGQPSSSRTLSSELSLAESGNTSNNGDEVEERVESSDTGAGADAGATAGTTRQEAEPTAAAPLSPTEATLVQELETLKLLNAEKEQRMAELNHSYSDLQDKHQDTLDYVEELKSEVTKAQMARPSSPSAQIIRRKSSQNVLANDRANRAFASLRNLALENFEEQPDTIQNFELNLNAIMTELHTRTERVQALETELGTVRKEMEGKMTLISGLTKERSSLKASSPLDISIVATMQEQIKQSEDQLNLLKEAHAQREEELLQEIANLKASMNERPASKEPASPAPAPETVPQSTEEGVSGGDHAQQTRIAELQEEAKMWQSKHMQAIEATKATEKQQLETVQKLESTIKHLEEEYAARINELEQSKGGEAEAALEQEKSQHAALVQTLQAQVDEHKATAANNATRLAELEESHARIIEQVEADAEARELTEKELVTHRSLVANLEKQVEEHKSALEIHQQRLESLQQSHAVELEDLNAKLAAKESTAEALQEDLRKSQAEIDGLLKGIGAVLSAETSMDNVQSQIKSLAEERASLMTKMSRTACLCGHGRVTQGYRQRIGAHQLGNYQRAGEG
jgi:kinesin family protein 4/21/27